MPRYFFHFTDGERQFSDDKGHELDGLRAARAHATQHVRELKAAMCDQVIQDLSSWSMSVADPQGRIVFVLGFDLKPRPVAPLTPAAPRRASPDTSPAPPLVPKAAPVRAAAAKTPPGRAGAATKH